ncbi:hypothetical protein AKJ64_03055 [candidate division MSBL1 archaeon SCGC-AAA259E17]|uniref:Uncharacterized protein n=1 Tax=candidate division MSBL1 archaeon SCGC-AAA259E17 TaxID=1698263 RepID=A0A133UE34_9EURY|nr:hypothetical protein AKJ64_03055 [candidate division MSBL1 archaeon SCGC-AAA259E17]
MDPENRGVTDIPIMLILCVFLTVIAVGVGLEGLSRTERLEDKQKSIRSFDDLVEVGTDLSYGGIGGKERIRLDLGARKIVVKNNLVQLESKGEILRSEYLPLPLFKEGETNFVLRSGTFSLSLDRLDGELSEAGGYQLVLELGRIA